jgi:hypothetical protein
MTLHSVRLRLTAWYAAVLAAALLAAGGITYAVARRQIERSADASIASTARTLAAALADEAAESNGVLLPRSANELLAEFRDPDRAVVLLGADGNEFAAQTTPLARTLPRSLLRKRPFGFSTVPAARLFLAPRRVGGASFVLAVAQSLAPQEETLADLRRAMLITAPLALLVAALGGWLLARKSLAPVDRAFARATLGLRGEVLLGPLVAHVGQRVGLAGERGGAGAVRDP